MSLSYLVLNRTSHLFGMPPADNSVFDVEDLSPASSQPSLLEPIECYTFYDNAFSCKTLSNCPRWVRVLTIARHVLSSTDSPAQEQFPIEGTSAKFCLDFKPHFQGLLPHIFLGDKVSVTLSLSADSELIPNLYARILTPKQFQGEKEFSSRRLVTKTEKVSLDLEKQKFSEEFAKAIAGEKHAKAFLKAEFSFVLLIDENPPDLRITTLFSENNIHLTLCEISEVKYKSVIAGQEATLQYTVIAGTTRDGKRRVISLSNKNQASQEHFQSFFDKRNKAKKYLTNIDNLKDVKGRLTQKNISFLPFICKLDRYIKKRLADFPTFNTEQHATQIIHLLAVEKHDRWAISKLSHSSAPVPFFTSVASSPLASTAPLSHNSAPAPSLTSAASSPLASTASLSHNSAPAPSLTSAASSPLASTASLSHNSAPAPSLTSVASSPLASTASLSHNSAPSSAATRSHSLSSHASNKAEKKHRSKK